MTKLALLLLPLCGAHEYLKQPPCRTADALLNAVAMGSKFCRSPAAPGEDVQCEDKTDPFAFKHLFHVHPAWNSFACGGSTLVKGKSGSQGLMQSAGDMKSNPEMFNVSIAPPEAVTKLQAGAVVDLKLHGFFHQGVMRASLCFRGEADCQKMESYGKYVLGYHFTEGTAGRGDDIYDVDLTFTVKVPRKNGRAVLQWLVDAEDVRSYVSCSDVEIVGAKENEDSYTCNGHPLCNCTLSGEDVKLGGLCPRGTEPSVSPAGSDTGTAIVDQYKTQVGVKEFCALCISNGCPSTCGGSYKGFYEGAKCTNKPVLPGCGSEHSSGLPRFIECTEATCKSSGWLGATSDLLWV